MASAIPLRLLMHSCYKERPLTGRFVEYYATRFIPFQAKLFYFKSHSSAKGFQCKSFSGGFPPRSSLKPPERRELGKGSRGRGCSQPGPAAGKEGTQESFSPGFAWLLRLPLPQLRGRRVCPFQKAPRRRSERKSPLPYFIHVIWAFVIEVE